MNLMEVGAMIQLIFNPVINVLATPFNVGEANIEEVVADYEHTLADELDQDYGEQQMLSDCHDTQVYGN